MDADQSTDAILQVLADPQRRTVLRDLVEESCPEVSVDALEEVVAHETEGSPPEVGSTSEIAIQLRHVHLPRLDDVGICEYDPDRECVAYCPNEFVERLLEVIEERHRPGRVH
jgi:DNA-binding transcriptional ArsR family regulator